jgi:predicted nucleic acid-binding protein
VIILDASALLDLLMGRPGADRIAARVFEPGRTSHAPHLIDLECVQVLRRLAGRDLLTAAQSEAILSDLAAFPLTRYPHTLHLERVWSLRGNLTAYDAAYVALAEALDAVLVTRDAKLAAAPGLGARVELV